LQIPFEIMTKGKALKKEIPLTLIFY